MKQSRESLSAGAKRIKARSVFSEGGAGGGKQRRSKALFRLKRERSGENICCVLRYINPRLIIGSAGS